MMKTAIAGVSVLFFSLAGAVQGAPSSNLSLRSEIDFGRFTGRITACGVAAESPVNHVKAKSGYKLLLVSVQLLKLKEQTEVRSASFVLEGSKGTFDKPGAWGKVELMGSKRDFEATAGGALIVREANETINLFFEIPDGVREQDLNLRYR